ncbi:hypothetical protein [Vasconcelosia minhoensis]|uniref:hypothetical protein n=1 Tax=Vasconcelosia minhoensis TaxID=3366354 RepID=UPI001D1343DB|nr:hypothetical protein [Romeria gracilis]
MISLPITLEQLIAAISQLQPEEQNQVAQALVQLNLNSDLEALIRELYAQPPADDVTDNNIMNEVRAVRQKTQKAGAIVSGDCDLRDDDELRAAMRSAAMRSYDIELLGVQSFLKRLEKVN